MTAPVDPEGDLPAPPGASDDEPVQAPADGAVPGRRLPWTKLSVLGSLLVVALVMSVIRLPYFVLQPGPAQDVLPLIHIQHHQVYPPDGHLLLTAVNLYQPNVYQALWAWIDSTEAVVPERDILGPGGTQQQESQREKSLMDQSQIDAGVVALTRYADYPSQHGQGVLVESVLPGTPADGKLFTGDLILSVDGTAIDSVDQLGGLIQAAGVGHPLTFVVRPVGKTQTYSVRIAPQRIQGVSHPAIGIVPVANFPFPLSIDAEGIGGPSAGLMWTLGLTDLLTPGELTGGKIVAGTGTIDLDGNVGPIGGIAQKVVAAERAGAVAFFAPTTEAAEARGVAGHMAIVPVTTFQDALNWLAQHGGSP